MPTRKILLVDDSEIALSVEKLVLEEAGFAVRTAHSLVQFDAVLSSWSPDVILTDVNMPDLTGAQLCQHLKARVASRQVPVVLFSSVAEPTLQIMAQDFGADAWLSKAAGFDGLSARVQALCEAFL